MKNEPCGLAPVLIEPDPNAWLNVERLARLQHDLYAARQTLALGGCLQIAVHSWLKQELVAEVTVDLPSLDDAIVRYKEKWRDRTDKSIIGLYDDELRSKLAVPLACHAWAEAQWGHRLETLFLKRKAQLDKASCRLLRVSQKGLALELYHRIKAKEECFVDLARRYGEGQESQNGGLIPLQPIAKMPLGLGKVLIRLEPGDLLPPKRLGKHVALVQLENWEPACFDEQMRESLLKFELEQWLKAAGERAVDHLMCSYEIDSVIP